MNLTQGRIPAIRVPISLDVRTYLPIFLTISSVMEAHKLIDWSLERANSCQIDFCLTSFPDTIQLSDSLCSANIGYSDSAVMPYPLDFYSCKMCTKMNNLGFSPQDSNNSGLLSSICHFHLVLQGAEALMV